MTVMTPEPMGSELAISDRQSKFSPAQRVALAHMGVDKAPDADVDVFFHVCQRTKLDPFARQIYMIGRWDVASGGLKYTIQTGIDGYRTIARRVAAASGEDVEYDDMLWCGRDGVWRDVWLGEPTELWAAKATVRRAGKPFTHVALWREYVQTKKDGQPNSMWATKGANQLAKCAEAGAIRKAFPQDYAGLYVDAELDHLASDAARDQTVPGYRDWYADAAHASTDAELQQLWSEAHRAHALDDNLKTFMREKRVTMQRAASQARQEATPAERIDQVTGEVLGEAVGGGEDPAASPSSSDDVRGPMVRKATVTAITRELVRCGVDAAAVDSYLPALGIPRDHLADLTQEEAEDLLGACRLLTRDQLAELVADSARA